MLDLKETGGYTHERLAEMPFWSDYDELIKSDIADIKNLGGPSCWRNYSRKIPSSFC